MRILLVVDLQKEFSDNCKSKYDEIVGWVKNHSNEYDSVVATRFVNKPNSPFIRYLGWNKMQVVRELDFETSVLMDYKIIHGFQRNAPLILLAWTRMRVCLKLLLTYSIWIRTSKYYLNYVGHLVESVPTTTQ